MEEHEQSTDSESSDEDYIPIEAVEALSEEDSGDECETKPDSEEESESQPGKRKKRGKTGIKKSRKKIKPSGNTPDNSKKTEETKEKPINEEEKKKREEALWADFMKDCGPPIKKKTPSFNDESSKVTDEKENKSEKPEQTKPEKVKITEIFEFAGEKVEVEKEVTTNVRDSNIGGRGRGRGRGRGSAGISAILGMIGKKGKLSTLEKSKLDWEQFKAKEGIQDEILTHNKGKNGYLEKQDFLERADLRQFELEKQMRSSKRSNR